MKIYLYVKKHLVSGLQYFGKTTKPNPFKYYGSGIYWKKHIKCHGKEHVETISVWEFNDIQECSDFAIKFSQENNIVESKEWANLKPENGLDGGSPKTGRPLTPEHKAKLSLALTGRKCSQEIKDHLSKVLKGKKRTDETKRKLSIAKKGKPVPHLRTEESRQKSRESRKNSVRVYPEETRVRFSEARMGSNNPFSGCSHSDETKKIMSKKSKERMKGRFWIVNKVGNTKACFDYNDSRITSGEYILGNKWRDIISYPCSICGNMIKADKTNRKTCSKECKRANSMKVDWDSLDLLSLLENETVKVLATRLGVCRQTIESRRDKLLATFKPETPHGDKSIDPTN